MIKINDEFSAAQYNRGWELHHTTKSDNPKSKTGVKTDVTFYATFSLLGRAVIDKSIGDVQNLHTCIAKIQSADDDILRAIINNNISE